MKTVTRVLGLLTLVALLGIARWASGQVANEVGPQNGAPAPSPHGAPGTAGTGNTVEPRGSVSL